MNPLRSIQRRALIAATCTMGSVLTVVLLYWQSVSAGSLPSPTRPLLANAKHETGASNPPPVKVMAALQPPEPLQPAPSKPVEPALAVSSPPSPARANPKAGAAKPAATPTGVAEPAATSASAVNAAVLAPNAARSATSSSSVAQPEPLPLAAPGRAAALAPNPAPPERVVSNLVAQDERLARHWLANTNERPTIRVRYQPADILRLSTELGRGLLVAGRGTSDRREVFLQTSPGGAPLFNPFTKSVAEAFSNYSLALHPSPTFDSVAGPLQAYFPNADFDLAFVPDNTLATDIFAQVARALRARPEAMAHPQAAIVEGELSLHDGQPSFDVWPVQPPNPWQ